jgi:two-component system, NtrC family, sensor kinase
MSILRKTKPVFLHNRKTDEGSEKRLVDFHGIWKRTILLMTCVSLIPLLALAYFDYKITQNYTTNEVILRADRLASNTKRNISFFLEERQAALQFIAGYHSFEVLNNDERLALILENLTNSIGGFTDLGLFNSSGRQIRYIGPYALKDKDYAEEEWFKKVVSCGTFISDVYLGFREVPHLVIAIKKEMENGSFYVLRATLSTWQFNEQLASIKKSGFGDAFLINQQGAIQTPSIYYGKVLNRFLLSVPEYSDSTQVVAGLDQWGRPIIMGYAYVPNSPYILILIGQREGLMEPWFNTRLVVIGFLIGSIILILVVIFWVATRLVNGMYQADQERAKAMQEAEQANKLASIGRLAAGVAHEINNPLAIINEKSGLIKDILSTRQEKQDQKIIGLVDSIHTAVERCATITRRLLGFTRRPQGNIQLVLLKTVIGEVLDFHRKEAEYRSITVEIDIAEDLPPFTSDRDRLQQIFLNLVNNAFAAMSDGGHLLITCGLKDSEHLLVTVTDDGHGIPEHDLKRIFEPFFSTNTNKGGTGLGLFITYNLIQELGGRIAVESEPEMGTRFFITLPLKKETLEEQTDAGIAG